MTEERKDGRPGFAAARSQAPRTSGPDLNGLIVGPGSFPGERGVFAARDFRAGERLGRFEGTETGIRTRMSLQFGPDRHIEPGKDFPLRYLNHACDPSALFSGTELFAARDLAAGTEITIDYNCHEPELAEPFACRCGSPDCVGSVRGGRFLDAARRAARKDRTGSWV